MASIDHEGGKRQLPPRHPDKPPQGLGQGADRAGSECGGGEFGSRGDWSGRSSAGTTRAGNPPGKLASSADSPSQTD